MQYELSPLHGLFSDNALLSRLDNLRFNFGIREEIYNQQIDQSYVTPGTTAHHGENTYSRLIKKGGLTFEYIKDHTLWFSMADGWMVPSTSNTINTTYPNYNLSPESSLTKELGVRGFFRDTNLSYDLTAYQTKINNYITTALCRDNPSMCQGWGPTVTAANANQGYSAALGNVDAQGIETALSYRPHQLVKLDVSHTMTWNVWDTYYSTTGSGATTKTLIMHGNTLQNSSKHHVNGRITVYPIPAWNIEFESDYLSRYNTNQVDSSTYARPMLFNLRSSYKWQQWTLSLQAINLFNTKYSSRVTSDATTGKVMSYNTLAGIGDGPFTFRAGIQYNF